MSSRTKSSSEFDAKEQLFRQSGSAISDSAWACTVYSLVPYVGIIFVPAAIAIGGFGYFNARRTREFEVARAALNAAGASIAVLSVQVMLWWLLYFVPEIGL